MSIDRTDFKGLLVVRDELNADGALLIAHALKLLLGIDGEHAVLLVAAKHTSTQYASVFRKLSLNASSLAASGRLVVLDALSSAKHQLVSLQQLRVTIDDALKGLSRQQRPLCLVYDDLSVSSTLVIAAACTSPLDPV